MEAKAKFDRKIGLFSIVALIGIIIFQVVTFTPFTAGGSANDSAYQLAMQVIVLWSGLGAVFIAGLAMGAVALITGRTIGNRSRGIILVMLGLCLWVIASMLPRGGDSMIGVQSIPVAWIYIGIGIYLYLKKNR